jgi:hypothetical protein
MPQWSLSTAPPDFSALGHLTLPEGNLQTQLGLIVGHSHSMVPGGLLVTS